MRQPAWAAAPGFPTAWAAVDVLERHEVHAAGFIRRGLCKSRVVSIPAEQVDVLPHPVPLLEPEAPLPEKHDESVMAYLKHARLPFPALFLDLHGSNAIGEGEDREWCEGCLVLGPRTEVGPQLVPGSGGGRYDGGPVFLPFIGPSPIALGLIFRSDRPGRLGGVSYWATSRDPGLESFTVRRARHLALRAIAVVQWLESVNVDLVETPLSPRQRKRELKKGRSVALTVQIRVPKSKPVSRNGKANYSHRFEVRGHYMHFTKGRVFEITPVEKRSFVPGIGECRKVWCPPHVKGPADKPLVPKVRVA